MNIRPLRSRRQLLTVLPCVLAAMTLSPLAAAQEGKVRIGLIASLSGRPDTATGESIRGAARTFVLEINRQGGFLGRQVELVEKDDQSNAGQTSVLTRELIEKGKVVAVLGLSDTASAMQAAPVCQEARVPLLLTAASGNVLLQSWMPPAMPDSFIFRVAPGDSVQQEALLHDILDKRKISTIALLHDQSPEGLAGKESLLTEMARRHVQPAVTVSLGQGPHDGSALLRQINNAGARMVLVYGKPATAALVADQLQRSRFVLPMAGSAALASRSFTSVARDSAEGVRMPLSYLEHDSARSKQFTQAYQQSNGGRSVPAAAVAAQTYDALQILRAAVQQAQSTEPDKIRDALEDLQGEVQGTLISRYLKPFSRFEHDALSADMLVVAEFWRGQVRFVYREDAAAAVEFRPRKIRAEGNAK
jgi:branched-chain amino acid transport system substrate-binding protein